NDYVVEVSHSAARSRCGTRGNSPYFRTRWFGKSTLDRTVWFGNVTLVTLALMRPAGEATRERILAAAKTEFSARGLAGARINRIATDAHASKERLYAYFPSKEALFAAVTQRLVIDVAEDVAAAS